MLYVINRFLYEAFEVVTATTVLSDNYLSTFHGGTEQTIATKVYKLIYSFLINIAISTKFDTLPHKKKKKTISYLRFKLLPQRVQQ